MLAPALYVLALFMGLSVVMGLLVAIHDGIEHLLARRQRAASAPDGGGQPDRDLPLVYAPARREPRRLTVVVAGPRERLAEDARGRERPVWYDAAARDVAQAPVAARRP